MFIKRGKMRKENAEQEKSVHTNSPTICKAI